MTAIRRSLLAAATLAFVLMGLGSAAQAAIYMELPHFEANEDAGSYEGERRLVVEDFSFGVEREMKESGESALEPQVRLRLRLDATTLPLIEAAMSGESIGDVVVRIEVTGDDGRPTGEYLQYTLTRCHVVSYSISTDSSDAKQETIEIQVGYSDNLLNA